MASKTTLNARNLEALGTAKLAALLIEISTGSAAAKRRLRIELAGLQGVEDVVRAVTQRLSTIERARTKVGWRRIKALKQDLDTQRRVILDSVAPSDPGEALALMWRFLALAPSVLSRCSDTNGTIAAVFHQAAGDLAGVVPAARPEPESLANSLFHALQTHGEAVRDLIPLLADSLGDTGLAHLKALFTQDADGKAPLSQRSRLDWIRRSSLQQIADATGDVDGYIALQTDAARQDPHGAAQIARRLLAVGRAPEALQALTKAGSARRAMPLLWETVYTEALEAAGQEPEAQTFRLAAFDRSLSEIHLKAFLKRLADFDDIEAEEKAMAVALRFRDVHRALEFFIGWPALTFAAHLVEARRAELDGDRYELLGFAAERLAEKHPLASMLVLRAMIDFTLGRARAGRYGHAGRHLRECKGLAARIGDLQGTEPHEAYVAALHLRHERKTSFWTAFSA